jgi:hypothetical protein
LDLSDVFYDPIGSFVVVAVMALVAFPPFMSLFDPTLRLVTRVIGALLGSSA